MVTVNELPLASLVPDRWRRNDERRDDINQGDGPWPRACTGG